MEPGIKNSESEVIRVLAIEDDEEDFMILHEMLSEVNSVKFIAKQADRLRAGIDQHAKEAFDVILLDLNLPDSHGLKTLDSLRVEASETPIIVLTGLSDEALGIEAVQNGAQDYLVKSEIDSYLLARAIRYAIERQELVSTKAQLAIQNKLLSQTLKGSIKVLTDVLTTINSTAFGRASRIARYAKLVAAQLKLDDQWQIELAAMLSQIGCITLPVGLLEKIYAGESLSEEEEQVYAAHPLTGGKLVASIPRLEAIARMIEGQQNPPVVKDPDRDPRMENIHTIGAHILKVVIQLDKMLVQGKSPDSALLDLITQQEEYDPRVVTALVDIQRGSDTPLEKLARIHEINKGRVLREVRLYGLKVGMIAYEDIRAIDGTLLLSSGQEMTPPILERLRSRTDAGRGSVKQPFLCYVDLASEQ